MDHLGREHRFHVRGREVYCCYCYWHRRLTKDEIKAIKQRSNR